MSQSLKNRLNGNGEKVVQYAREFGVMAAMEEYGIKDYLAMRNYLKEKVPDEEFPVAQVNIDDYAGPDAFDKLLEAMLKKYFQMESANKALVDEIAELRKQVEYYKGNRWRKARPVVESIFQYCKE